VPSPYIYENEIASLNLNLRLVDLKSRQDLSHCPTDVGSDDDPQYSASSVGYTGPSADEVEPGDFSIGENRMRTGKRLPINLIPGAPQHTFVYGASPNGYFYSEADLIKCPTDIQNPTLYGPDISFYQDLGDFFSNALKDPGGGFNVALGSFVPGIESGAGTNNVYIPHHHMSLPPNVVGKDNSTDGQKEIFRQHIYETNNIWDFNTKSGIRGSASSRYIFNQGPITPSSLFSDGYIKQQNNPEGNRITWFARGTFLKIYKVDNDYFKIDPNSMWIFMGSYRDSEFFEKITGIDPQKSGFDKAYMSAAQKLEGVALFRTKTGKEYSSGINAPFRLKIDITGINSVSAFRSGFPTVMIILGNGLLIDGDAVKGAQIILSPSKPPQITFPVRATNANRYLAMNAKVLGSSEIGSKTIFDAIRDANRAFLGILDLNVSNISNYYINTVTGKNPLKATDVNGVALSFQALGDVGEIRTDVSGETINAIIAPQMGVSRNNEGLNSVPQLGTSSYCAMKGSFKILATNCNGIFDAGPICYQSWNSRMIMFRHHYTHLFSGSVLKNFIMSGNDPIEKTTPYAKGEIGYSFNTLINNSTDELFTKDTSVTRYPDAISDPRGGMIISLHTATLNEKLTASNLPVNGGAVWETSAEIEGSFLQGPIGDGFETSDLGGSSLSETFGIQQIQNRGLYDSPSFGNTLPVYNRLQVPTVAVWAHAYQNSQLLTIWPEMSYTAWVSKIKGKLSGGASLPSALSSGDYSNYYGSESRFNQSDRTSSVEVDSDSVSSFNITSSLSCPVITRTATIKIVNPSSKVIDFIRQQGFTIGSQGWVDFSVKSLAGKSVNFSGFVTSSDYQITGHGAVMTLKIQDPVSYLLSKLKYPADHPVDGWLVHLAVPYILGRLGLPMNYSVFNVQGNIQSVPRIGRWIATDTKTKEISFNEDLNNNLQRALGVLFAYQYPVFYWSGGIKNPEISYRNAYDLKHVLPALTGGYRNAFEASSMFTFNYFDAHNKNKPLQRDSFRVSFDNTDMNYQNYIISEDRWRQIPIWVPMGMLSTPAITGFRSEKDINVKGVLTERGEINVLKALMERQNQFLNSMTVSYTEYGLPASYVSEGGGAGFTYRAINIPFTNMQSNAIILRQTDISWDAESGNNLTTNYEYELLKPSISEASSNMITG